MTIFVARGQEMQLVIDTAKKLKFENFQQKMRNIPQKKAENMQNSYSGRKGMFQLHKLEKKYFFQYILGGRNGLTSYFFSYFSKFSIF